MYIILALAALITQQLKACESKSQNIRQHHSLARRWRFSTRGGSASLELKFVHEHGGISLGKEIPEIPTSD
jgi:hypothetical protein